MSLEILERNEKTQRLLAETREQAAQLEEQTVELGAQQDEINATEAWFRGIIESAPDGMLVADENGRIVLANPQLEAMFGYAAGELVGAAIETLVPQAVRVSPRRPARRIHPRGQHPPDGPARRRVARRAQGRLRVPRRSRPVETSGGRWPRPVRLCLGARHHRAAQARRPSNTPT